MEIRDLQDRDWEQFFPVFAAVVVAGETYAYPPGLTSEQARALWVEPRPSRAVVAADGDTVLGSAKTGPNRPGRGAHVATASFMVDPAHGGKGVGRALGEFVVEQARRDGYRGIQFNAVVETNVAAVRLWTGLGFQIIGTVPGAFEHARDGFVGLHVMYLKLA